jgi:choline transport protein
MAEEVADAAVAVPRAMITIFLVDCILVFPLIITICYHLPDIDAALNDSTDYPGIYIMRQAMSNAWIAVILAIMTAIVMASNITYLAGVSRDLFAFARDQGLPFSAWFSKVDAKRSIPRNANLFSCILSAILALIYIGSPVAFYAITSLNTVSLLQCYVFAIGCVLWRRLKKPETLPPARWSLGRWGVPINIAAVLYSVWSFFWCFWPQATPVTAGGFNWAGPLYVLALIVSALYYIKARHTYVGPVMSVDGRHGREN